MAYWRRLEKATRVASMPHNTTIRRLCDPCHNVSFRDSA
jgi:hypothetical protein